VKSVGKFILKITALLAAALITYLGAAALSALFPVAGRAQTIQSNLSPIYLCADLVHSDFAVTLHDQTQQWSDLFGDFASPQLPPDTYLLIGWGDYDFFTKVRQWGELTAPVAFNALTGQDQTALRVLAVNGNVIESTCQKLVVDVEGRRKFFAYVLDSLPSPIVENPTASRYQTYFMTQRHYSPFYTCNQWTADGLAAMGLPHAWFSPFSFSMTWPQ
jgi:uncharacterized protein (TIGR02117 family)